MRFFDRRGGMIRPRLSEFHLALLGLVPKLLATVGEPGRDPAGERLRPEVFPDDPERSAEFRRLSSDMIEEGRATDNEVFAAGLERAAAGEPLTLAEAESWMRALAHARVILGARLGIEEDGWEAGTFGDDSRVAVLHFLGLLQEDLITALTATL